MCARERPMRTVCCCCTTGSRVRFYRYLHTYMTCLPFQLHYCHVYYYRGRNVKKCSLIFCALRSYFEQHYNHCLYAIC
ncbi:hypothetical protein T492DRAFT_1026349 [Pavlovales sp. CCMP2436]|nr:hypothetical protein T492DRAFT_1026349 [Pavlovales sp. CCMP2436]